MCEDREKLLSRLYRGNMMPTQKQDINFSCIYDFTNNLNNNNNNNNNKTKLRGFSPRANYTDRAAAAGRRS